MIVLRNPLSLLCCFLLALLSVGCQRPLTPAVYTTADNVAILRSEFQKGGKSADTAAVATAEPTGWATIKGSVVLQGSAPPRASLNVDKETDICMPGGKKVLSEALVTGPKNELYGALIYLNQKIPSDEKWEHPSYAETKTATIDFDQKACIFLTHTFAIRSTQLVKIINSDPIGHNTNIAGKGRLEPFNQTIAAKDSVIYSPKGESPEPTSVSCSIHPWMSANMIARDNPYFAVTGQDGTFEIANIPAGVPLEFRVWHEGLGGFVNGTVTLNGKEVKVSKGKLAKLTANDKDVIEWKFEIPAPK